ncbi:MAG TPA: hypothetical protein VK576_06020 [Thermoleophilia bacterium]|nr:hypothetical protein [Thermoleophilia bacterium]
MKALKILLGVCSGVAVVGAIGSNPNSPFSWANSWWLVLFAAGISLLVLISLIERRRVADAKPLPDAGVEVWCLHRLAAGTAPGVDPQTPLRGQVEGLLTDAYHPSPVALFAFADTLLFIRYTGTTWVSPIRTLRRELESAFGPVVHGEVSCEEALKRPSTKVAGAPVPVAVVDRAVLKRGVWGLGWGWAMLSVRADDGTTVVYRVTRRARQPLAQVLTTVLGDRFEHRFAGDAAVPGQQIVAKGRSPLVGTVGLMLSILGVLGVREDVAASGLLLAAGLACCGIGLWQGVRANRRIRWPITGLAIAVLWVVLAATFAVSGGHTANSAAASLDVSTHRQTASPAPSRSASPGRSQSDAVAAAARRLRSELDELQRLAAVTVPGRTDAATARGMEAPLAQLALELRSVPQLQLVAVRAGAACRALADYYDHRTPATYGPVSSAFAALNSALAAVP